MNECMYVQVYENNALLKYLSSGQLIYSVYFASDDANFNVLRIIDSKNWASSDILPVRRPKLRLDISEHQERVHVQLG